MLHETIRASLKLGMLILWIAACYAAAWVALKLKKYAARDRISCVCYTGILWILGIRLTVTGDLSERRPLLLVSNHISYLDVALLGSQHAVRFTPKSEIAGWPFIGAICRLCECIFVDRRPEKTAEVKAALQVSLAHDQVISLFPEGTTGNGLHLQSFKSSFFSLAEEKVNGQTVHVQPAVITYTHIRRLPIDTTQWPSIAWYGDMDLSPHLWSFLKLGLVDAELVLLPQVTLEEFGDRKKLAAHCQQAIGDTIETLRGRRAQTQAKRVKFQPRFLRVKP